MVDGFDLGRRRGGRLFRGNRLLGPTNDRRIVAPIACRFIISRGIEGSNPRKSWLCGRLNLKLGGFDDISLTIALTGPEDGFA